MLYAAYGEGNYLPTLFHRLISNRFSHLVLNLFCGAKERDCVSALFIHTDRESRVQRRVSALSKTTEVLPMLNLTMPLETERGGSHSIWHVVPSIVPFEILRVGGKAICRVG